MEPQKLPFISRVLKCKTIFYATCHLSGEIFSADVDALWSLKSSLVLVEIFEN